MKSNYDVRNADKGFYSIANSKQTPLGCILLAKYQCAHFGRATVKVATSKSQIDTSVGTKVGLQVKGDPDSAVSLQ